MEKKTFSLDLGGQVALVTGAGKGMGRAIALGLAQAGAKVAVLSRTAQDLIEVGNEIRAVGGEALEVVADLRNTSMAENIINTVIEKFKRFDILVNCAGAMVVKPAQDMTEEDWDNVFDVNLKGLFFLSQAAFKPMASQKRGKIVNIASIVGKITEENVAPYCASKGGVIQITKALALEWAQFGINVNAVGPGYIETPLNQEQLSIEAFYDRVVSRVPLRRVGQPEDIVGAVVFLASSGAEYITGETIFVDGGWLTN